MKLGSATPMARRAPGVKWKPSRASEKGTIRKKLMMVISENRLMLSSEFCGTEMKVRARVTICICGGRGRTAPCPCP